MRNEAGFTLIEMIVVLVVAGLLLGLILQHGPLRSSRATFLSSRNAVLSELRTARLDAQTRGEHIVVQVDAARQAIIESAGPGMLRTVPIGRGVTVSASIPMHFAPDGTGAGGPWRVSCDALTAVFAVSPLTGRILADGA
ncbi:prepilin-type N-terminal cleavage/methylation domain-containing protein [Gluconobacter sp. Dm-62]|uniref:prepilin-type N-terminal cleavage/methylation domain-containing protein n=1 Tax=Gluconobacter sp. Dm-62 TaxID=2799804 RepID=UPI001B8C1212|nr:prepilin-type N-terminal cleavage/methylation domain-containing protein [Gluconobacter sp. Dm-62]MBS1103325.1 prepilin-type N-terminal cleavage/methylation domain-containing protein [Gluconobacter sp. Dm-62]